MSNSSGPQDQAPVYCPNWLDPAVDGPQVMGCGSADVEGPDEEGLYDCNNCGIWFRRETPPEGWQPTPVRERMADEARRAGYASLAEAGDAGDLTALADRLGISLSALDDDGDGDPDDYDGEHATAHKLAADMNATDGIPGFDY